MTKSPIYFVFNYMQSTTTNVTEMLFTSHLQLQEARPRVQAEPDGAGRAQAVHRVRRGVRQGHHLRESAAVAQDQASNALTFFVARLNIKDVKLNSNSS